MDGYVKDQPDHRTRTAPRSLRMAGSLVSSPGAESIVGSAGGHSHASLVAGLRAIAITGIDHVGQGAASNANGLARSSPSSLLLLEGTVSGAINVPRGIDAPLAICPIIWATLSGRAVCVPGAAASDRTRVAN